jgi:hypothetical protein
MAKNKRNFYVEYEGNTYEIYAKDRNEVVSIMAQKMGLQCRDFNHKLKVYAEIRKKMQYFIIDENRHILFSGNMKETCEYLNVEEKVVRSYVYRTDGNNDFSVNAKFIVATDRNLGDVLTHHNFNFVNEKWVKKFYQKKLNELEDFLLEEGTERLEKYGFKYEDGVIYQDDMGILRYKNEKLSPYDENLTRNHRLFYFVDKAIESKNALC